MCWHFHLKVSLGVGEQVENVLVPAFPPESFVGCG